ncbi:MAG: hypothetical protein HQ596_02170 [Candidatus Saganbacteria bacterium]|nr:hypothetical protein [Candidatus Saganbacteria bacterium]
MSLVNILYVASLILEVAALILGVMLATKKKKAYGWCIALAFALWLIYDYVKFSGTLNLSLDILSIIFFVAVISITWALWKIYQES